MIRKSQKSLKLSLRGGVEIQAQYWPDRLCKPRTRSVGTDWLGQTGCVNRVRKPVRNKGRIDACQQGGH